jgi:hypothetical protein
MKQIELFGCTGAGKTTFGRKITNCKNGNGLILSEAFLLENASLGSIKNKYIQLILLDFYLFYFFLLAFTKYFHLFMYSLRIIASIKIPLFDKANIIRNIVKRIGAYEIIHRSNYQQIILVDGGTLQIVQHLFVHVGIPVHHNNLRSFIKYVPIPEAAIYFTEEKIALIDRTIERGHKRIPDRSPKHTAAFVDNAIETFEELLCQLESTGKMVLIDNHKTYVSRPHLNDFNLLTALNQISKPCT